MFFWILFNILIAFVSAPEDDSPLWQQIEKHFYLPYFLTKLLLSRFLVLITLARCWNENNTRRQFDKLLITVVLLAWKTAKNLGSSLKTPRNI